jgi:hypothetical protein
MNTNATIEYIRAEEDIYPSMVWEFSVLDRACFSMVIRGTWIFDLQLDVNAMKADLRKLLDYYPHLSGRMKDNTCVHLTNDGVPFTVKHESGLSIADAYKKHNLINHFSMEIRPSKIRRGIDAPLSIKITRLRDGSVLGIQCFHACMDADSFYTMVYNWGQICKKEDFTTPVLDQSLSPVPENLSKDQVEQAAYEHGWEKITKLSFFKLLPSFISGVLRERTSGFNFSANALNRLKQEISTNNDFPCSTNVALCALVSKMLMKLYNHSENTKCIQVTVVNIRKRLADIPSAFVGNASAPIPTPPFSASASIDKVARIIHQSLEPIRQTRSQELTKLVSLAVNVLNHRLPLFPFDVTKMLSKRPTVIHINNVSKLHIYDIDFGSGKPVSVIPHNLSDPVLIWPAPRAKGGVEVYFSGIPARRIRKLKEGDSWFQEMNQYRQ